MVVDKHDVAQLLGVFLHVGLGLVDIGLGGGDEIVGIVAHVAVLHGHKHTVRLEELAQVGLGHITDGLGQLQIVGAAVALPSARLAFGCHQ